jgi:hypothetical protein
VRCRRLDGLLERDEPDAALIGQPGALATAARGGARPAGLFGLEGRSTLGTKLVVAVGELASGSTTWSLHGAGAAGTPVVLGATTAAVARRRAGGSWRWVIDNAWGDQAVTG